MTCAAYLAAESDEVGGSNHERDDVVEGEGHDETLGQLPVEVEVHQVRGVAQGHKAIPGRIHNNKDNGSYTNGSYTNGSYTT